MNFWWVVVRCALCLHPWSWSDLGEFFFKILLFTNLHFKLLETSFRSQGVFLGGQPVSSTFHSPPISSNLGPRLKWVFYASKWYVRFFFSSLWDAGSFVLNSNPHHQLPSIIALYFVLCKAKRRINHKVEYLSQFFVSFFFFKNIYSK